MSWNHHRFSPISPSFDQIRVEDFRESASVARWSEVDMALSGLTPHLPAALCAASVVSGTWSNDSRSSGAPPRAFDDAFASVRHLY